MSEENRKTDLSQFDEFARNEGGFQAVFNRNNPHAYAAFSSLLRRAVTALASPLRVLDIGCGDGWTAGMLDRLGKGRYLGIDRSAASLDRFRKETAPALLLEIFLREASAEWLLCRDSQHAIKETLGGEPNLVICNASLHQIRKAFQETDVLVASMADMVRKGMVLIGEYYYPGEATQDAIQASYEWIRSRTGQNPTPAEGFPDPETLLHILQSRGLRGLFQEDVWANDFTAMRYRGVLMQKR